MRKITPREYEREVGFVIRDIRLDFGLTQHELAKTSRVSRSAIANIETGRQRVSVRLLVALARGLKIEPGDVLDGVVEKK